MKLTRHLILTAFALAWACAGSYAAASETVGYTTADGLRVQATAVTPYIIRVDALSAGQKVAPAQSVLPIADANTMAHVRGTTLYCGGGAQASISNGNTLVLRGAKPVSTVIFAGRKKLADGRTQYTLTTAGNGSLYGGGERGHKYNLRGDTLVMYNRQNYGYTGSDPRIKQMNITMPLVLSPDGYALVFDDFAAAELISDGRIIKYITESEQPVSFYYISGTETLADLTSQVTALTGRQPLPPFWALGYITSKYGYRTQAETLGVVDTLKQQGYPLDGIVLDLYWYGKEEDMGRLAWDPEQWPAPGAMLDSLRAQGVNLVAISQPYVLRNGRGVENYNYLADNGMLVLDSAGTAPQQVKIWVGDGGMLDVSNPATRQWLAHRYGALTDGGITGWWGDLGEPEVHPESGRHANGLTARQYHNKYGNDWAQIIADLYAAKYPDTRLMTLMRGGTTGLQRHSVFPWSTDVSRSWGGLEPQIRIMLNSGLSGLGYMSSDLGGFAVDEDNPYMPELYVRWLQAGLFTPVFRTHAQQYAEPYNYPQYAHIINDMVKERYRWLPYNYTLAYENAAYGYPLARPLDFEMENAAGHYDAAASTEYLWGADVLVAPVLTEGATERKVVFPAGSDWIDYSSPRNVYAGGTTAAYDAPLEKLPLFVRRGAFIPLADYAMANTGDYNAADFTVRYFPGTGSCESAFTLYDDDKLSPSNLEKGQYRLITFSGDASESEILITVNSRGSYAGAPAEIALNFVVEGLEKAPKNITINGKSITPGEYNAADGSIAVLARFLPGKILTIKIKR